MFVAGCMVIPFPIFAATTGTTARSDSLVDQVVIFALSRGGGAQPREQVERRGQLPTRQAGRADPVEQGLEEIGAGLAEPFGSLLQGGAFLDLVGLQCGQSLLLEIVGEGGVVLLDVGVIAGGDHGHRDRQQN